MLPCIREAEKRLFEAQPDHEYAPIDGLADFREAATKLALGVSLADAPVVYAQTLSGTGALRVAGEFLARFRPDTRLHVPSPTWGNHKAVFGAARVDVADYRYYDAKTNGLDFEGMAADIAKASPGDTVLLHACAHNPTGVDPSAEQWRELSAIVKRAGVLPLFDMAYQGFASGDADADAAAVRAFLADGHHLMLTQSFAKNMGLYGERAGGIAIVTADKEEAERVASQLKIIARQAYSNPPLYGARLVATVLNDASLAAQWRADVKGMADRIIGARAQLVEALESAGSNRDWSHIVNQIGMFSYTGLTKPQVERMRDEHGVFMTADGRVSMAGVNATNVEYLGQAMHEVTKE